MAAVQLNARAMQMIAAMNPSWYPVYPAFVVVMVLFYGIAVGAQCWFEPAAVFEAVLAGGVLDDPVEGDVLADHELAHVRTPLSSLLMRTTR